MDKWFGLFKINIFRIYYRLFKKLLFNNVKLLFKLLNNKFYWYNFFTKCFKYIALCTIFIFYIDNITYVMNY